MVSNNNAPTIQSDEAVHDGKSRVAVSREMRARRVRRTVRPAPSGTRRRRMDRHVAASPLVWHAASEIQLLDGGFDDDDLAILEFELGRLASCPHREFCS